MASLFTKATGIRDLGPLYLWRGAQGCSGSLTMRLLSLLAATLPYLESFHLGMQAPLSV